MTERNPYAPSTLVDEAEDKPLPLQRTGTRWREFPAALLIAIGTWAILVSFSTLLLPDDVRVGLFGVEVTDSGAMLCMAAGCSWLISANALVQRRWSGAVLWLGVGLGCLGAIAWLNLSVSP